MNSPQAYGIPNNPGPSKSKALRELEDQGFTILQGVFSHENLIEARRRLDDVHQTQEKEFRRENLASINELSLARLPLSYDDWFLEYANNPAILEVVRQSLGDFTILHLQNGILNMPDVRHHQSAWHRDLPYQEWTSTRTLALSALCCLDPFTDITGGTLVLPGSHRLEKLPSLETVEQQSKVASAPEGSVIIFDSMLLHRAGHNVSGKIRRGINHVYTIPLLKQQVDIPAALKGRYSDQPKLAQLLGYTSQVQPNVKAWPDRPQLPNSH